MNHLGLRLPTRLFTNTLIDPVKPRPTQRKHPAVARASQSAGRQNLPIVQTESEQFMAFQICQTPSDKSSEKQISQTPSAKLEICGTASHKSADTGKLQTVSAKSLIPNSAPLLRKYETPSRIFSIDLALYLEALCRAFPLSWSHYVRLLSVEQFEARRMRRA